MPSKNGRPDDDSGSDEEVNSSMEETKSQEAKPVKRTISVEEASETDSGSAKKAKPDEDKDEDKLDPEIKKELDKFWKAVRDDPTDFTGWTYLLQFVDSKNHLISGREAFSKFLQRYPYCYGYWKKFADFEKRNGSSENAMSTFQQGTQAIPLSVDLWIHYLNYVNSVTDFTEQFIREQYEKAIQACGKEWRCDRLWEHYIKFETEKSNWCNVYEIYRRVLNIPTQGSSQNFEKFKAFIKGRHPKDVMDTADFLVLRKEVLTGLKQSGKTGGDDSDDEDGPPGGGAAPGEEGQPAETDQETQAMRDKLVDNMREVFKPTEKKVSSRTKYEEKIKRPYFHVKPLERGQLKNWNEYLDYMKTVIGKDCDESDVEILYERCMIACAMYEEFWMNYISWLESLEGDNLGKIRNLFSRACDQHLPSKIDIHCRWAAFEETEGCFEKAAEILANLEKVHPELVSLQVKRINLERRRGNHSMVEELFESAIKNCSQESQVSDLAIKYSRFLRLHLQNSEKAKEVLNESIERQPTEPKLYTHMLDILLHTVPVDVNEVVSLLDKALAQDFKSDKVKFIFSQRKVNFLEDFGTDIKQLMEEQKAHLELSKKLKIAEAEAEPAPEKTTGNPITTHTTTTNTASNNKSGGSSNGTTNSSSATSFPPVGNSPAYNAHHTQNYMNNSSRYSTYPNNYGYGAPYYPGYQGYQGGGQGGY